MKKFVSVIALVLALGLGSVLHAGGAAAVTKDGSDFQNRSRVGLGNYPGAFSYIAVPMTAQAAITVGMPVMVNTDSSSWFNTVSKTTTAGPIGQIGIATNTAAAGEVAWIAISGVVPARFTASMTTTAGIFYTGTTNGDLTPTSTVTGSTQTSSVSIVQVLESKIVGTDGLARCLIVR